MLGDREMIARLKVQRIEEAWLLGAIRNDKVEVLIVPFHTVNQV
jgi:hypothetical protein